jgi:hypothetical protein
VYAPSSEDGKRFSFPNSFFSSFLEYRTMNRVEKPSNSECYTSSSEPFRIYEEERVLEFISIGHIIHGEEEMKTSNTFNGCWSNILVYP